MAVSQPEMVGQKTQAEFLDEVFAKTRENILTSEGIVISEEVADEALAIMRILLTCSNWHRETLWSEVCGINKDFQGRYFRKMKNEETGFRLIMQNMNTSGSHNWTSGITETQNTYHCNILEASIRNLVEELANKICYAIDDAAEEIAGKDNPFGAVIKPGHIWS